MHDSLLLPRGPDDAQDRMPDDPPVEAVPPEKLPQEDEGDDKGKGKEIEEGDDDDRKEYRAGNCNDCNRQFCLDYNLPICKGAGMEDVFTTCFRESARCLCGMIGFVEVTCGDDEDGGIDGRNNEECARAGFADIHGAERDSRKDEAVVFIFIFATAGLLIWAAIKPWVGKWVDVSILCGYLKPADGLLYRARENGGIIYRYRVRVKAESQHLEQDSIFGRATFGIQRRRWTIGIYLGSCWFPEFNCIAVWDVTIMTRRVG